MPSRDYQRLMNPWHGRLARVCRQTRASRPCHGWAIRSPRLRDQAWRALSYKNEATLSKELAAQLSRRRCRPPSRGSKTFAACPFKHFAQYGLQLKSREVRDFTIADIGQAYHLILEQIVQQLLQAKQHWTDLSPDQAAERITATAATIAKKMRDEVMLSTARNKYLLGRIERTLSQVIASQRSLAERQSLRLRSTNVKFGSPTDKLQSPLIVTPAKREVRLQGKIDRIDIVPGRGLFSIVDYKSGNASLKFQEVFHGLAMQLLAYMLVLRENKAGQKLTPIGAFYQRVTRSLASAKHPSEVPEPGSDEFLLQEQPRGIFHADHLAVFDSELTSGASLAVNAYLKKDNTLGSSGDAAYAQEIENYSTTSRTRSPPLRTT